MNREEYHYRNQLRWFSRNLHNRPLLRTVGHLDNKTQCAIIAVKDNPTAVIAILQSVQADESTINQVLDAAANLKGIGRRVGGKVMGIGRRQTDNYRGVSVPFVDGTTRFMLPQSAFERFHRRRG